MSGFLGDPSGNLLLSLKKIFAGTEPNDCPKPCSTTSTYTRIKSDFPGKFTVVTLNFARDIRIKKTEMVKFNFLTALSILGSNMGLWLGLGVVQFMELLGDRMKK